MSTIRYKVVGLVLQFLFYACFVFWISQSLRLGVAGNAEMFQRLGSVAVAFVIFFFGLFHFWHSIFAELSKSLLIAYRNRAELQMVAHTAEDPVGDDGIAENEKRLRVIELRNAALQKALPSIVAIELVTGVLGTLQWGYGDLLIQWFHGA